MRFEHYNEDTMKYLNLKQPLYLRNVSNGSKNKTNMTVAGKRDYREFYNANPTIIWSEGIIGLGLMISGIAKDIVAIAKKAVK